MLVQKSEHARARRVSSAGVAALTLVALLVPLFTFGLVSTTVQAQDSDWSAPRTVFIPDTGQTVDGVFLDEWRAGGGVSSYGNPITPELTENGRTVQYYEYARFEYVPDDPDGNVVHLGNIGRELKPVTVFRTIPALESQNASGDTSAAALAAEVRAWVPLNDSTAAQPDTDTRTYIADTRHTVQNGFKDFWESTGGADYLGNPISEEFENNGIRYQVFERGKLEWTATDGVTMIPVGTILTRQYHLDTKGATSSDYPTYSEDLFVAPAPANNGIPGELWIEVNLSSQYMIVWNGTIDIGETYVSTGREGFDTPTGTFYINSKLESQTMEGVLGGEYYNVPDVPWVMYFTDRGHAIHGTYWHNNFGSVMSHGCVNLPMDFAAWLYGIAGVGTRVEIHY